MYLLHTLSPLFTPPHSLCCSVCIVCRVCRVHGSLHTCSSGVLLSFVVTCINYTLHTLYALTPLHPPRVSQILINSTLTLHYYALSHPPHTCTLCASIVYLLRTLSPLFTPPHTLCCSECIVCEVCRVHGSLHTYASGVLLSVVMTCINYTLHTLYALTPLHPPRVSQILINSTLTLHYYALSHPPHTCTLCASIVYLLRTLSPLFTPPHTLCCSECIVCEVCRVHGSLHTYASGVLLSVVMTCINYTLHTLYALTPLHPPRVSQILINSTLTLHYYALSHPPHTCTLCASIVYLLRTLSPLFTPPHTLCCSECIVCEVCRVHGSLHTYASGVLLSVVMTCINYTLHTLYALTPLHPSRVSQILINSTLTLHYYAPFSLPPAPASAGLSAPLKT